MDLLYDMVGTDSVITTELSRKLTIDGVTKAYPVYKVRLDLLYYNDQNDRIATWVNQYINSNSGHIPSTSDRASYNAIIEEFIIQSNPSAIEKTQINIELVDQREPGVILPDGRIIDGNRRFTCLRRLAVNNSRFRYFETVILQLDIHNNPKQIKMLELSIQHGEEKKIDYNSIDKLVGIYHDIIETGLLTVDEYAQSTNESIYEIRKKIDLANLMIEFLDFIKMPGQFYVARDYQLYSVLVDLQDLLRRCSGADTKQRVKNATFTNIMMKTTGDSRKFIRSINSIAGSNFLNTFLNEQEKASSQIDELLRNTDFSSPKELDEFVRENEELADDLVLAFDKSMLKVKKAETKEKPAQIVSKSISMLKDVDVNIFQKLNNSEKERLKNQLGKLSTLVETFDTIVDDENAIDLSKPNRIQSPEIVANEISKSKRYYIAAPNLNSGMIMCSNDKVISNSIFYVGFNLLKTTHNISPDQEYVAFFISETGEKISNEHTIIFSSNGAENSDDSVKKEFTLINFNADSKVCYLGIRYKTHADNELMQMVPFKVQLSFASDFEF